MDLFGEFGDTNTTHAPGYTHSHKNIPYYLIMCFHTPFSYYSNGDILEGNIGEVLINPPYEYVQHSSSPKHNIGFANDWIYISGKDVGKLLKKAGLPLNKSFPITNQNLLAPFIKRLNFEFLNKDELWQEKLSVLVCDMIITIARNRSDTPRINSTAGKLNDLKSRVTRSLDYPWTLAKMAEVIGYSPSRFSYLYSKQFGIAPMKDLVNMRVERAKNMLKYSDINISMASTLSGFSSVNYFTYTFKSKTGYTPSKYKKEFVRENLLYHKPDNSLL